MRLKPDARALREERFQNGHMIGSYWDAVARWMNMRAQQGADVLKKLSSSCRPPTGLPRRCAGRAPPR
eukprot:18155-Pyramimonas_sp.AAC.1